MSGFWDGLAKQIAGSQPWTSGKQTGTPSETCLEKSYGRQPWREEESRRAGWFSRITSSMLKNDPSPQAEIKQSKPAWISRSSWLDSDTKRRCTGAASRGRWPRRNVEILTNCGSMGSVKPKLPWSLIWQEMWTATRKISTGTSAAKERLGRTWPHCYQGRDLGEKRCAEDCVSQCTPPLFLYRKNTLRYSRHLRPVIKSRVM